MCDVTMVMGQIYWQDKKLNFKSDTAVGSVQLELIKNNEHHGFSMQQSQATDVMNPYRSLSYCLYKWSPLWSRWSSSDSIASREKLKPSF